MIILDTNVLSELMRKRPEPRVVAWLDSQSPRSVWISSVTVLEIQFGLEILAPGKRRSLLMRAFDTLLTDAIGERVASFDTAAARHAATLMSARHKTGRAVELRDTLIAGVVLACRATLATRNTAHFDDLGTPLINPWAA